MQDAQRARESVLKEAEQKLKELELTNQMNETQVKRPVEDVINSLKPIQFTNQETSFTDYGKNEFKVNNEMSSSNYAYGASNYAISTPTTYNSYGYNTSAVQEPTKTSLTTTQSCLPQTAIQPTIQTSIQPSTIPSNNISTNIHSQATLSQPLGPTTSNSLSTVNNSYLPPNNHANNLTANLSSNLQPNSPILTNQLTKLHQHQQSNSNQTNLGQPNSNAIYNQQLYSTQSHPIHTQSTSLATNLPNYNAYQPVASATSYPMNNVYNLPYQTMTHLNRTTNSPHHQTTSIVTSVESAVSKESNPQMNYNSATTYVPSSSPHPLNGILLPQQSPQSTNNANRQPQNNDKTVVTNGTTQDFSNAASMPNNSASTTTQLTSINPTTNPFMRSNGKKIDVADFENSSSPFDDALLRSIDDKEELNNIFQQFYHNGAK